MGGQAASEQCLQAPPPCWLVLLSDFLFLPQCTWEPVHKVTCLLLECFTRCMDTLATECVLQGARPNIGREPDHGKWTRLIFRLIGMGTGQKAPVAVSDYDKNFANSIGAS